MKIRWTRESVRFRITPLEMERLQQGEGIEEVLAFGAGRWSARIAAGSRHRIVFTDGSLTLELSAENMATLADPANEGVYFHQDGVLQRYFVEKDFPCVHPRGGEVLEPATETFAAPEGFEARKIGD